MIEPKFVAAASLARSNRDAGYIASFPELTEADAYAVQAMTMQQMHSVIGGWKVAIVGGRPVAAPLWRNGIVASGAKFEWIGRRSIKIETELGFMLARDVAPGLLTRADLVGSIETVHAVFELVAPRVAEPLQTSFNAFLADNLGNAATVVGMGQKLGALPECGRLYRDGQLLAEGPHPQGDALAALSAYAAVQPDALGGLRRGQLIITGSYTGAATVTDAASIQGSFEGMASVELQVTRERRV